MFQIFINFLKKKWINARRYNFIKMGHLGVRQWYLQMTIMLRCIQSSLTLKDLLLDLIAASTPMRLTDLKERCQTFLFLGMMVSLVGLHLC